MFSGITRGLFPVVEVARSPTVLRYAVDLGPLSRGLEVGASVSIDGVCQTAVAVVDSVTHFEAIEETRARSTLADLVVGRRVSVERSLRVGDEIGGHEVSGHVIGTGEIAEVSPHDPTLSLRVRVPSSWMRYVLPKGFVAVDGSSLTVGETDPESFWIHLIPETLRLTTLGDKAVGDRVNIELDARTVAIVDTVERILESRL
jgi:riboflavin synthase